MTTKPLVRLVDDDDDFRASQRLFLGMAGFEVDDYACGEVFLAEASLERPGVIVVDLRMPGIDGIETARRIRSLVGEDTMIIMITAYDWSGIEAEARAAGIDYFIAKPLFRSAIYDTFSKLDERNPEPSGHCDSGLAGKRFLLAEDNELNREIAEELLKTQGLSVSCAENGQIAVDMFKSSPSLPEPITSS